MIDPHRDVQDANYSDRGAARSVTLARGYELSRKEVASVPYAVCAKYAFCLMRVHPEIRHGGSTGERRWTASLGLPSFVLKRKSMMTEQTCSSPEAAPERNSVCSGHVPDQKGD